MNNNEVIYKYNTLYLLLAIISGWLIVIGATFLYSLITLPFGGTMPDLDVISAIVIIAIALFLTFKISKTHIAVITQENIKANNIILEFSDITEIKKIHKFITWLIIIKATDSKKDINIILPQIIKNYRNFLETLNNKIANRT